MHQRVRVGKDPLRSERQEHRRGQRLRERPEPLRVGSGATLEAGDQDWTRRIREQSRGLVERARVRGRQRRGPARGRRRNGGSPGHLGRHVEVHRPPRLVHRELGRVGGPVRRRSGVHGEARLAPVHAPRMAVGHEDHRGPIEGGARDAGGRRGDAGTGRGEGRARRAHEVARHRRHDARRGLVVRQHDGQPPPPRRLDERELRAMARHAEDPWRPGTLEAVDDHVGDGRTHAARNGRDFTSSRDSRRPAASGRAPTLNWPRSWRTTSAGIPRRGRRTRCRRARPRPPR